MTRKLGLLLIIAGMISLHPALSESLDLSLDSGLHVWSDEKLVLNSLHLGGNATLRLVGTSLEAPQGLNIRVSDNALLELIDSNITLREGGNIQIGDNAALLLTRSTIHSQGDSPPGGIGAASTSSLYLNSSQVGFIRLAGEASLQAFQSQIGEFASRSTGPAASYGCQISHLRLFYESSQVAINNTTNGFLEDFNQSQTVVGASNPFQVQLVNTTLLQPPSIVLLQGTLHTSNTSLTSITLVDSALRAVNTNATSLYLTGYSWAELQNTTATRLTAYLGDFNLILQNTHHEEVYIDETLGLNLKAVGVDTGLLRLGWTYPDTPQNVELINSSINELHLWMYSPQPIQLQGVHLGNLTLNAAFTDQPPLIITGSIDFHPNATVKQEYVDGYTKVKRVHMVRAYVDGEPAPNLEATLKVGNRTASIWSDQKGVFTIPIVYASVFRINTTSNTPPTAYNNLTQPATLTILNHTIPLRLTSDSPQTIDITQNPPPTQTPWIAPALILATAIGILTAKHLKPKNPLSLHGI